MKIPNPPKPLRGAAVLALPGLFLLLVADAQTPQAQQQIQELRQAMATNEAALLQFTWREQQSVLLKGELKEEELFQVRLGPDGAVVRTPLGPQAEPSVGHEHGLRGHIKEKKTEEFQDYAEQIAALAHSYTQPQPGRIRELYQQGNVMLGSAGAPGLIQLTIHGYIKPGDVVTLVFNGQQKQIVSAEVSSYLNDPGDAVKISAQYAPIPGGPNHVSQMVINGESKQLTVQIQNSDYHRIGV
jgi:hypothetical protein